VREETVAGIGSDDLIPLVVVLGAALAVWLYNALTGSRPGRRGRNRQGPPPADASP
jgi:hypothetical protein